MKLYERQIALVAADLLNDRVIPWYVHVASAFPLAHHYRSVLAWVLKLNGSKVSGFRGADMP